MNFELKFDNICLDMEVQTLISLSWKCLQNIEMNKINFDLLTLGIKDNTYIFNYLFKLMVKEELFSSENRSQMLISYYNLHPKLTLSLDGVILIIK